ncbi:MAG: DUF5672 family protein [Chloroflexota bacterium]
MNYLTHFLSGFQRYLLTPQSLKINLNGFDTVRFEDRYFSTIASYSKLLLSPKFYAAFINFNYILIYQLDCLVFSDQLEEWCGAGYDYIGAPLFRDKANPAKGFSRVGNGGLSLRRVLDELLG